MTAQPLPPSALDKLVFLAGHWRGGRSDVVIEEMWLAPAGGVAQGVVRLLKGGEVEMAARMRGRNGQPSRAEIAAAKDFMLHGPKPRKSLGKR